MFTGIIEATGKVDSIQPIAGDWRFRISSNSLDFSDVGLGDSICVSGVCLTVVSLDAQGFAADVSRETMNCSNFSALKQGDLVNLEKAMTPSSRLGGHIVSGHVDGIAKVVGSESDGRSQCLWFSVPVELARYIAHKGSVCLDGVSLTVNDVKKNEFSVNIIPHTAEKTTIHLYEAGRKVNLEVDVLSRYLERLMQAGSEDSGQDGINPDFLARTGFSKISDS